MDEIHPSGWPPKIMASREMAVEREGPGTRGINRLHRSGVGTDRRVPHWPNPTLFLLAAPLVGSLTLLWYAWDTVSVGDRPLNTASIQNIRQVVQGMMLGYAGAVVDWQHPNDQGPITLRIE